MRKVNVIWASFSLLKYFINSLDLPQFHKIGYEEALV